MRALLRLVVTTMLTAVVVLFLSATAWAHTTLTSTEPSADATVGSAPQRVTATFDEPLQPTFAAMTVVGPDDHLWSSGDPVVQGSTVSVALRTLGPAGRYTVNYRVASADGHAVSGAWSFTVTTAGTGTPGPEVPAPDQRDRIPVLPLVAVAAVLVVGAAAWGLRRRP